MYILLHKEGYFKAKAGVIWLFARQTDRARMSFAMNNMMHESLGHLSPVSS